MQIVKKIRHDKVFEIYHTYKRLLSVLQNLLGFDKIYVTHESTHIKHFTPRYLLLY